MPMWQELAGLDRQKKNRHPTHPHTDELLAIAACREAVASRCLTTSVSGRKLLSGWNVQGARRRCVVSGQAAPGKTLERPNIFMYLRFAIYPRGPFLRTR